MYCLHCQKEYKKEMFCPKCGRMLVSKHTFDYEKSESHQKDYIKEELNAEKQRIEDEQAKKSKIALPKCPTCGSTNIRHITATERGINAAIFGLFGNKRKCQFECLNPNCRYRW